MASYILKQGGADDVILALGISIDFNLFMFTISLTSYRVVTNKTKTTNA
jgi:hypothetical protein